MLVVEAVLETWITRFQLQDNVIQVSMQLNPEIKDDLFINFWIHLHWTNRSSEKTQRQELEIFF